MTIKIHDIAVDSQLYISIRKATEIFPYKSASIYSLAQLGIVHVHRVGTNKYFNFDDLVHWYNHKPALRGRPRNPFAPSAQEGKR